jgi:hypothetical protein
MDSQNLRRNDSLVEEFLGNGDKFRNEDFNLASDHNVIFEDSDAVSTYYRDNVGRNCHRFASKTDEL